MLILWLCTRKTYINLYMAFGKDMPTHQKVHQQDEMIECMKDTKIFFHFQEDPCIWQYLGVRKSDTT